MSYNYSNLGELCSKVLTGGTPLTSKSEYYEGGTIPWLKTKEVNFSRIYSTEYHITGKGLSNSSAKLVPENSVIVAMYGQGDTAGRVAINKIPIATNQACCNLIIDEVKADYRFVYYALKNSYEKLVSMKNGGAQPNLNTTLIKGLKVPVPPLEAQRCIADILSAYDDLIENNQKQIKLLEEAAMRLYKEWFVKLRFPGYESTKIVDGVPEGWNKKKLIEIADIVMGQSPKSQYYNTKQDGLPFHQGVTNYGFRYVKDDTYTTGFTRIAAANSILFSVRAPVGRLNITRNKIVIGRGLSALNHKLGYQSFLFYLLKEYFYKDNLIGNGAIYASITKGDLENQVFLLPSDRLIEQFDNIAKPIDAKIDALDNQITLLRQARDKLLPKLMSGEIEV